jgi:uncharacterized membrane protein YgaE (UPF0421/DUF939 family)
LTILTSGVKEMAKRSIYLNVQDEREMTEEALRRGVRTVDIMRERLEKGKAMEDVENLKKSIERLEKKIDMQADWINTISALILAKTSFLEELFLIFNKENETEERTQAAHERAAKFMETLRR